MTGQATRCQRLIEDGRMILIFNGTSWRGRVAQRNVDGERNTSAKTKWSQGEPAGADDAYRSMQSGKIEQSQSNTIADGLLTTLGDKTFPIIHEKRDPGDHGNGCRNCKAMRLIWNAWKWLSSHRALFRLLPCWKRNHPSRVRKSVLFFLVEMSIWRKHWNCLANKWNLNTSPSRCYRLISFLNGLSDTRFLVCTWSAFFGNWCAWVSLHQRPLLDWCVAECPMILTGMGPIDPMKNDAAKLFASFIQSSAEWYFSVRLPCFFRPSFIAFAQASRRRRIESGKQVNGNCQHGYRHHDVVQYLDHQWFQNSFPPSLLIKLFQCDNYVANRKKDVQVHRKTYAVMVKYKWDNADQHV